MQRILFGMCVVLFFLMGLLPQTYGDSQKLRIFVVNSYHREYVWEQEVNEGFCAAMLDFKFLDSKDQADIYTSLDFVETDHIVLKKVWMDSKRKNIKNDLKEATREILKQINEFKPDLIVVGDDNASNYIGSNFVDTKTPVVFRGIIESPVKYGLADSLEHPGHNITGILKPGYPQDTIENFSKLVPQAKTFAILADNSETSKGKIRGVVRYEETGKSPLKLTEIVYANSFSEWQDAALRLQKSVDAFLIVNHNTLKDETGASADPLKVTAWYLQNIKKPDMTWERQMLKEGYLLAADDSAYKQGYEVVRLADMVIHQKKSPADIPCLIPQRGKILANRQRAQMLGIDVSDKNFIEGFEEKASALEKYPRG
ncbi:MAG: hypothetical protein HQL14_03580 [Candidatus Omnitrophica bacterium]|nr:hypothetical protein [Candidatus Omnitrophota bacterium]